MNRVVKQAGVRRTEILDIARKLFFARGYEATSIDDILTEAQLSKGAFYHHFRSKEDLLEALAEDLSIAATAELRTELAEPGLNAFERLNAFMQAGRQYKVARSEEVFAMFETMFREENLALYYRLFRKMSKLVSPLLAEVIQQGMDEEVFLPGDAAATADIVMVMSTATHEMVSDLCAATDDASFKKAAAAFEARWLAQGIAIDRILGLPEGSLTFIEPGFAEAFFSDWRARRAQRG